MVSLRDVETFNPHRSWWLEASIKQDSYEPGFWNWLAGAITGSGNTGIGGKPRICWGWANQGRCYIDRCTGLALRKKTLGWRFLKVLMLVWVPLQRFSFHWSEGDSHVQSSLTMTSPGRKHTHIRGVSLHTALIQASPGISTSAHSHLPR